MSVFTFLVIVGVFIASVSQLLLKQSAIIKRESYIREYLNSNVIIAYFLFALSVGLNIIAMKQGVQLKEIPVLETLGYIFVFSLSYFFLKERLNLREIIAASFIIVGIIVFYL